MKYIKRHLEFLKEDINLNGDKDLLTDGDGDPIVFYHGTTKASEKSIRENGFNPSLGRFGRKSISFSDERHSKPYNKGGLIRAHISMKKPMDMAKNFEIREKVIEDLTGKTIRELTIEDWRNYTGEIDKEFTKRAKELGYDGMYDPNQPEIIVFDVNNIHILD